MNCCICGEPIENNDYVLRLAAFRFVEKGGADFTLRRARFDDGTDERFAHYNCPVQHGAPMSLIGADTERIEDAGELPDE